MRDGFIIHEKTLKQAALLEPDDMGYLLSCLTSYYYDGEIDIEEVKSISVAVAVILMDAIERMDADAEAYERVSAVRSEAGKAGAEARWGKQNDSKAMANDGKAMANDSKHMASDSDSVSDSVSKEKPSNEGKKKSSRFSAPTVEQVQEYIAEKGYSVDAERFVDFYASKGWKVGSSPMKDWKAAVRNWARERKQEKPPNKFNNFTARKYDFDELQRQLG